MKARQLGRLREARRAAAGEQRRGLLGEGLSRHRAAHDEDRGVLAVCGRATEGADQAVLMERLRDAVGREEPPLDGDGFAIGFDLEREGLDVRLVERSREASRRHHGGNGRVDGRGREHGATRVLHSHRDRRTRRRVDGERTVDRAMSRMDFEHTRTMCRYLE